MTFYVFELLHTFSRTLLFDIPSMCILVAICPSDITVSTVYCLFGYAVITLQLNLRFFFVSVTQGLVKDGNHMGGSRGGSS